MINIETESYPLNSNISFYSSINVISEPESDNNREFYNINESSILNLIINENIPKYNYRKKYNKNEKL